jgi:hypothetical protein
MTLIEGNGSVAAGGGNARVDDFRSPARAPIARRDRGEVPPGHAPSLPANVDTSSKIE